MWVCFYLCWRERRGWEGGGGLQIQRFFWKVCSPDILSENPDYVKKKKSYIYNGHKEQWTQQIRPNWRKKKIVPNQKKRQEYKKNKKCLQHVVFPSGHPSKY